MLYLYGHREPCLLEMKKARDPRESRSSFSFFGEDHSMYQRIISHQRLLCSRTNPIGRESLLR